jgi:glyoxylase-like metal-dependent hydrolase (beta-lactamase superfamily II)
MTAAGNHGGHMLSPQVHSDYDPATGTFSHIAWDHDGGSAVVIDPVLDFDPASGRIAHTSAQRLLQFLRERTLRVHWILETHAHADHLSAADYLREQLGARVAIGRGIVTVQRHFRAIFGLADSDVPDGGGFDRLLDDGEVLQAGTLQVRILATPGHTPDGMSFVIGDAAFIGDTLFAPEQGTARCDFPGGDAQELYASIHRLLALPAGTRLFLCHDYPGDARLPNPLTSSESQRRGNIHVRDGIDAQQFVTMRRARDTTLAAPRLLLPSLQVNIRGGQLPAPASNGTRYLKLPLRLP